MIPGHMQTVKAQIRLHICHYFAPFAIILNCLPLSCIVCHYLALFAIILHCLTLSCTDFHYLTMFFIHHFAVSHYFTLFFHYFALFAIILLFAITLHAIILNCMPLPCTVCHYLAQQVTIMRVNSNLTFVTG